MAHNGGRGGGGERIGTPGEWDSYSIAHATHGKVTLVCFQYHIALKEDTMDVFGF
jgi:hypothetical protein